MNEGVSPIRGGRILSGFVWFCTVIADSTGQCRTRLRREPRRGGEAPGETVRGVESQLRLSKSGAGAKGVTKGWKPRHTLPAD